MFCIALEAIIRRNMICKNSAQPWKSFPLVKGFHCKSEEDYRSDGSDNYKDDEMPESFVFSVLIKRLKFQRLLYLLHFRP